MSRATAPAPMENPAIQPHDLASAHTWRAGGRASDRISRQIADALEHAVDRLDPRPAERVLDVATGTGWTARRIATRGARVTGIDIGEEVIASARQLGGVGAIDYRLADAEALPFADRSFDAVVSTFGVMFCRRPERAAGELARICKPGGRLVLATWTPTSRVREMFELIERYSAPAAPAPSPFAWGDTARVVELLGEAFDLGFETATSYYRTTDGAAAFRAFAAGFGPVVSLLGSLPEESAASFRHEFELFHERHRTGAGVLVPREYLITVGRQHA